MILRKEEEVQVLSNNGGWLEIKAHDKSGWISENLVISTFQ